MTTPRITEATLHALADDAFQVLNWARRMGMKRDQQQAEVVKAFRLTLDKAGVPYAPGQARCPDVRADEAGPVVSPATGSSARQARTSNGQPAHAGPSVPPATGQTQE